MNDQRSTVEEFDVERKNIFHSLLILKITFFFSFYFHQLFKQIFMFLLPLLEYNFNLHHFLLFLFFACY